MTIELQLLGGLDFVGPDPALSIRARRRHPMMLLALAAATAPRAISRDRVMAFLWPESDSARASNSLRQALHSLRRELGEDLFLPETAGGLQLDRAKLSVDLWTFRDAVARQKPADAVAAYRGAFLDGFPLAGVAEFSRWVEVEREQLARDHRTALDSLACQAEIGGRHDEAVAWRRRLAAADPFSSRVALGLMRALVAAGDRPGALEYAGVYEGLVRAELEVDPDPVIADFVASLRRTPVGEPPPHPQRSPQVTPPAPSRAVPDTLAAAQPAVTARPTTAAARLRGISAGTRWLMAAGVTGVLVVGVVGAMVSDKSPAATVLVLATGASPVAGRDTSTRLIECDGPMCPRERLPQYAYVVPTHGAHTDPAMGTHYIAPLADGTTLPPPGYACCSTAVFENRFPLPSDAVSATISITVLADNQAIVAINGVEFGRQSERLAPWNHGGPPTTFATTFLPDPSGINRLEVTLWDGGGAAALNYRAFVSHDTRQPVEEDG